MDFTLPENMATAWAEKYQNLHAKVQLAEKFPAFYSTEAVLKWKREAAEALKNYHFWLTEV